MNKKVKYVYNYYLILRIRMTNNKVLILTWSYGGWHNTAASSLEKYYKNIWYETKVIDIIDHISSFWAKSTKTFYKISSEEYPKVWKTFFNGTDYPIMSRILYWIKDPIWQPKFNKLIEEYNPKHVISVFPFWNLWVKNYIKYIWHNFKWWILVTDSINIQSFWYVKSKYVDNYFVFDKKTKKNFIEKFEFDKNKVKVSFFPFLRENFINKKYINNKKILILLTWLEKNTIKHILDNLKDFDITIIKWRNNKLYEELINKYNYKFIEYINIMENLKFYDIMIWKPWWALTCECIATNTPLIIPSYFPWQEEGNKELIEYTETWIYEKDPYKITFFIKYMDWNKLLPNFKKAKKENSCDIIYKNLI